MIYKSFTHIHLVCREFLVMVVFKVARDQLVHMDKMVLLETGELMENP